MTIPHVSHRFALVPLGLLLAYVTATSAYEAMNRPFWYDEVFTVVLTRLGSIADIRAALENAADTSPPGYYVIQRALAGLAVDEHLGFRVASIVAVSLVSLLLFVFARRHLPLPGAAIAAVIPLLTQLYHHYSVEARPYALVVCFVTLAMVAWQRAASTAWILVLAAALAAGVSVSYYAVFAIAPFALAEVTYIVFSRRARPAVWVALVAGAIPLFMNWPLLTGLRAYHGDGYWSKAQLSELLVAYDWFFVVRRVEGSGLALAAVVFVVLVVCVCRRPSRLASTTFEIPLPEVVALVLGLIALPVMVMGVAQVFGGGFAPRYAIALIPGLALGVAFAAQFLAPRYLVWILAGLVVALGAREVRFWVSDRGTGTGSWAELQRHEQLIARAGDSTSPVVVSDGVVFVPLAYYRTDADRSRLIALVDPEAARQHAGADSIDLDLAVLRSYMPIRVVTYESLMASYDTFLLYSTPGAGSWWPSRLQQDAHVVDVVASEGSRTLYLVRRNRSSSDPK